MNDPEPILVKAGSNCILLGMINRQPPEVDCRVVAEEYWQEHHIKRLADLNKQVKHLKGCIINMQRAVKDALIPEYPENTEDFQCQREGCDNDMAMYPNDNTLNYCQACRHEICQKKGKE